jgi:hypothetical protein
MEFVAESATEIQVLDTVMVFALEAFTYQSNILSTWDARDFATLLDG